MKLISLKAKSYATSNFVNAQIIDGKRLRGSKSEPRI